MFTSLSLKGIDLLSTQGITALIDEEGLIQNCNQGLISFLNLPRVEILEKPLETFISDAEIAMAASCINNALSGKPENTYLSFKNAGDKRKIGNVTLTPVFNNNLVTGVYCFIKDVSRRVEENKSTFDSEQRLKAIFENEPECVKIISLKGLLLDINPAGLGMIEADNKSAVLGADVMHLIHEEDKDAFSALHKQTCNGEGGKLEFRMTGLKGTKRWMDTSTVPLKNKYGDVYAVLSVTRDITERKRTEMLLSQSESRFRALVEQGSDLIGIVDYLGNYKYVGPSIATVFGYNADKLIGKNAFDFIHPEDVHPVFVGLQRVNSNNYITVQPFRFRNSLGDWRWIETKAIDKSADPSIGGIIVNSRDITEKIKAEEIVKLSEQKFKALVHNGSDIIVILDEQGNFTYCSENVTKFFGYDTDELLGKNAFELVHPEDLNKLLLEFQKVLDQDETATGISHRLLSKKGVWVWIESKGINHLCDPLINGIIINAREINDRIKLQQKLDEELAKRQKEITAAIINTQEKERSQLGLELHDNVNQVLTTIKLYNEMLLDGMGDQKDILSKSVKHLQECINEIRSISKRLSAPTLGKISLQESIKELVDSINLTNRLSISYQIDELVKCRISQEMHLAIYRIIQEHLNNILKHAEASTVVLKLRYTKGILSLQIKDDGKGFDTNQKRSGIGITNIFSRAEHVGGTIKLDSQPGKGCTLKAQFKV